MSDAPTAWLIGTAALQVALFVAVVICVRRPPYRSAAVDLPRPRLVSCSCGVEQR